MPNPKKNPRQVAHESVSVEQPEMGSDRAFGLVMATACTIITLILWVKDFSTAPVVLAIISCLFLASALLTPALLHPAHVAWMKLAHILHRIISPVVLALLFYGGFTPTALWIRLTAKDPLRLSADPDADSYWIDCRQEKSDLKKQF
ncbi:MAG: SxtJ family membrane protein [Verrucomicrobiota bacterium]